MSMLKFLTSLDIDDIDECFVLLIFHRLSELFSFLKRFKLMH